MERYRPSFQEAQTRDPVDVKAAKASRWLDRAQIFGGGLIAAFINPALGIGIMAWNGAQHVLTDKYINWRNRKRQQVPQAA